jgi:hypothetical protein
MGDNAGKPARQTGRLIRRETIGPTECPIMIRWTLLSTRWGKLMVHRFLPNADDRATHDHPSAFWTLVLRGSYDDMAPCETCESSGRVQHIGDPLTGDWIKGVRKSGPCPECDGDCVVARERMRPGMLRFRPATHAHRTRVGPNGCWTVVLMGPEGPRVGLLQGRTLVAVA